MSQDRDRDLRRLKTLEALAAEEAGTPEGELSAQRAQETRARLGLAPPREAPPPPKPGSEGGPKRKPRVTPAPMGTPLAALLMRRLRAQKLKEEHTRRRNEPDEDEEGHGGEGR